jgi:uncharacterized protein (TIGR02246 family)
MSTTARVDLQAEEQAIREQDRKYMEAAAGKDADALTSLFAEDAAFLYPGMPLVRGRSGLRDTFMSFMQTPGFSLTFEPTRIEVSPGGEMAYELGTYRLGLDRPEGRVDDRGKYATVWKKVGGQWKIAVDAPSSELPPQGTAGAA